MNPETDPKPTTNPQTEPQIPPARGLQSPKGIRWLVTAGSLLTAVSVYQLVERHWAHIPVEIQFLMLVAGALAVFGYTGLLYPAVLGVLALAPPFLPRMASQGGRLHRPFPEGAPGEGSWLLSEGGDSLPVPAGALVVFPAGLATSEASEPRRWS
jgi:hypothetical protein